MKVETEGAAIRGTLTSLPEGKTLFFTTSWRVCFSMYLIFTRAYTFPSGSPGEIPGVQTSAFGRCLGFVHFENRSVPFGL